MSGCNHEKCLRDYCETCCYCGKYLGVPMKYKVGQMVKISPLTSVKELIGVIHKILPEDRGYQVELLNKKGYGYFDHNELAPINPEIKMDPNNCVVVHQEDDCKCGHARKDHIYEEGACRPGFECGCTGYYGFGSTTTNPPPTISQLQKETPQLKESKFKLGDFVRNLAEGFLGTVTFIQGDSLSVNSGEYIWHESEFELEPLTLTGDFNISTPQTITVKGLFLKHFQKEVHERAKEKGWYNPPKSDLEVMALIHSEISEAVEELRSKEEKPYLYQEQLITYENGHAVNREVKVEPSDVYWVSHTKPLGLASELADAVIRILDYCEWKGIDLEEAIKLKHAYNKTRPYRHGKKI